MIFLKKAELLAPAGNMEKFKMALHYGADAVFIKQCKNTRDSSTRRVLVMRHVLVGYELHEDFSKHIGKLVCRHGAKPCNKETELLGTLKASITTT